MSNVVTGRGWTMHEGDCLEVMRGLPKVDAVVTDPPYGVGLGATGGTGSKHGLSLEEYASHDDSPELFGLVAERIAFALEMSARAAVFMSGRSLCFLPSPDALGGVYLSAGCGRSRWGFTNLAPVAFYGTAPDLHLGGRATVLASNETAEKNGHPVPKPIGWMLWLVGLASRPNHVILDPFAGSGTTGVAALRLGRRFIGIEKDPRYFQLACERLRAEENGSTLQASRAGQTALFVGGGR